MPPRLSPPNRELRPHADGSREGVTCLCQLCNNSSTGRWRAARADGQFGRSARLSREAKARGRAYTPPETKQIVDRRRRAHGLTRASGSSRSGQAGYAAGRPSTAQPPSAGTGVDELLQSWHKAAAPSLLPSKAMRSQGPPTARQIYALAAALCEKNCESFPETLAEASAQLERLRNELGHPAPHHADCPPRFRRRRARKRGQVTDDLASVIAAELAREMCRGGGAPDRPLET